MGNKARLQAVQEDIEYEIEWLKEARSMITTKRYKNIPEDIFKHMHTDFGNGAYWTDSVGFCGDDYDGCCEDEGLCCPHCGSDSVEDIDSGVHPVGNYEEINIADIPFQAKVQL